MMANDELKKKIAQIIADYFCPQGNTHKSLWGDDRLCYSKMNFAECEWVAECTDALIAAGLTFDKTTAILAERTNSKTLIHKAQYYDEMKHRAEVAERALIDCVEYYSYSALCPVLDCNYNKACWRKECNSDIVKCFKIQAEKELAEEGKDENY